MRAAEAGNAQGPENGNIFVGWGTAKRVTDFSSTDNVVFGVILSTLSCRGYRELWP